MHEKVRVSETEGRALAAKYKIPFFLTSARSNQQVDEVGADVSIRRPARHALFVLACLLGVPAPGIHVRRWCGSQENACVPRQIKTTRGVLEQRRDQWQWFLWQLLMLCIFSFFKNNTAIFSIIHAHLLSPPTMVNPQCAADSAILRDTLALYRELHETRREVSKAFKVIRELGSLNDALVRQISLLKRVHALKKMARLMKKQRSRAAVAGL
jgi:hypothetical protein